MSPATACPKCGDKEHQWWLNTTNEWRQYCPRCNVRYNDQGTTLDTTQQ